LKGRSVEENANLKRQTKAFLQKEKLLEARLRDACEDTWTLQNTLQEKVGHSFKHLLYILYTVFAYLAKIRENNFA